MTQALPDLPFGPASTQFPGRAICQQAECGQPVEANPTLYLSLFEDGHWEIVGVGDDNAPVQCTEGHDQQNRAAYEAMSAFLESAMPGTTWAGSAPSQAT